MHALNAYLSALPGWLIAVITITSGWLAAGVARFVVTRLLAFLHFNQLCTRTGVGAFLRKGEVVFSPAELVGQGIYWVVLIGAFLEAARLLDIGVATEFRHRIVAALPALLSGALVLAVGLILVAFVAGFVRTVTRNAGSPYANLWSRITRWVGVVLVLAIAFEQAEIRGSILAGVIQIVIAAIAFGMALAFGLGCKEMARNAMEKLVADLKERHRDSSKPDMEG
jgi:xanthine/uracil/vitamin C permease (AzgA family)